MDTKSRMFRFEELPEEVRKVLRAWARGQGRVITRVILVQRPWEPSEDEDTGELLPVHPSLEPLAPAVNAGNVVDEAEGTRFMPHEEAMARCAEILREQEQLRNR